MGDCQWKWHEASLGRWKGTVLVLLAAMDEIELFIVSLSGIWVYYKMISSMLCCKTSWEV